jgi:hypothetical protein
MRSGLNPARQHNQLKMNGLHGQTAALSLLIEARKRFHDAKASLDLQVMERGRLGLRQDSIPLKTARNRLLPGKLLISNDVTDVAGLLLICCGLSC